MTRINSHTVVDLAAESGAPSLTDSLLSDDCSESYGLMVWLSRLRQTRLNADSVTDELNMATPRRIGRFQLECLLGAGAYGAVFRALDTGLGRRVALKVAWPGIVMDPVLSKRFAEEPKTVASFNHLGIVGVLETGNLDLAWFMVLELIDGPNLEQWLASRRRIAPPVVAEIMRGVARAVDYAHSLGVIHRDLKPSNILLRRGSGSDDQAVEPVVTDFGLAHRPEQSAASALTATCVVLGTDHYMSPEQAAGLNSAVGPASDIFSLGVILYELTSGTRPFDGASSEEVRRKIREVEPRSIRGGNYRIPRDLETVIFKCLEKSPARRYSSAQELADDLDCFLNHRPIRGRRSSLAYRCWKLLRRRPLAIATSIIALASAILVTGLCGAWIRDRARAADRVASADSARAAAELTKRQHQYAVNIQRAGDALRRGNCDEASSLLENCRHVSPDAPRCGIEWGLLQSLLDDGNRAWVAHRERIKCLRFSPNGAQLASAGEDGRLILWDFATNAVQWEIKTNTGSVNVAEFSPNGELLAIAGNNARVTVFQTNDGAVVFDEAVDTDEIRVLTWLGNESRIAAGGSNEMLTILDLPSKDRRVTRLSPAFAVSANGGKTVPNQIHSMAFLPEQKALAVVTGLADIQVISLETLDILRSWPFKRFTPGVVCYLPIGPGYLLTNGGEGLLRVWAIDEEHEIAQTSTIRNFSDLRYSPNGKRAFGIDPNGLVMTWDIASFVAGKDPAEKSLASHSGAANTLDVSPDGAWVASGGVDGRIVVRHAPRDDFDIALDARCAKLLFSPCGCRLAVLKAISDASWGVDVFELKSGRRLWSAHPDPAPEFMSEFRGFAPSREMIAFSPSGESIVSVDADFVVRARDTRTGAITTEISIPGKDVPIQWVAYSPDGKYIVAQHSLSNTAVFDATSGELNQRFDEWPRWRLGMFHTVRGNGWIDVRPDDDESTNAPSALFTLVGPEMRPCTPVVSRDGKWFVFGCADLAVYVWNLETGKIAAKLVGHDTTFNSLAISPDAATVLSQSFDGVVRLWHRSTGEELLRIGTSDEPIQAMALSPSGELLALAVARRGGFGIRLHRLRQAELTPRISD